MASSWQLGEVLHSSRLLCQQLLQEGHAGNCNARLCCCSCTVLQHPRAAHKQCRLCTKSYIKVPRQFHAAHSSVWSLHTLRVASNSHRNLQTLCVSATSAKRMHTCSCCGSLLHYPLFFQLRSGQPNSGCNRTEQAPAGAASNLLLKGHNSDSQQQNSSNTGVSPARFVRSGCQESSPSFPEWPGLFWRETEAHVAAARP